MHYSHLAILLPLSCSSFCPAPAVLLPCSFQVPIPHIPSSSPVPAQLLPAFCPVLLYSAQLCSCPVPALLLSPTLLMLQPRSCFAPALLLPCSWSCQPQFGSLHHHHQHLTTFFGTARAAFYGIEIQPWRNVNSYPTVRESSSREYPALRSLASARPWSFQIEQ